MEFVDGVNLRRAMKVGRFTPSQALAIVPKICEALPFAHNESILHRDIKPENILVDTKGRVKIADFGIAKLVEGGDSPPGQTGTAWPAIPANLTETGQALGTPDYMAPEQREHPEAVDQRADIYSLGVVFYEMLTGELPLGHFPPPSEKSSADPRVDKVVLRTLEKERERRYQQVGDVKTEVETITSGAAVPAALSGSRPTEDKQSISSGLATRPWALMVVAALFIVSGCSAAWDIAHGITRHNYRVNLAVLAIPIGVGLLRRRRWWRIAALVALWTSSHFRLM
jgi:serine/threonine protein kinase